MKKSTVAIAIGLVLASAAACKPAQTAAAAGEEHRPVHIDSIFPIEEEVRRFRARLGEQPESLAGGAESREALVRQFVEALQAEDLAAADRLRLSAAEFAYLYYPYTRYTEKPYELSPALLWFRMENLGGRGIGRAMQRHGGRDLGFRGHRCDVEPAVEAANRIWTDCVVYRETEEGIDEALPILGPILEREGRFKFLSFANGL